MRESLLQIEAHIDDMNPQYYEVLLDELFALPINDAWLTPIIMKKGRPGIEVHVLCEEHHLEDVTNCLFTHTTTLGVRYRAYNRITQERRFQTVHIEDIPIRIKEGFYGEKRMNAAIEYEDLKQASLILKRPLKELSQEVWAHIKSLED